MEAELRQLPSSMTLSPLYHKSEPRFLVVLRIKEVMFDFSV